MAPLTGTGERYALEMGELWSGLSRTLARLDGLAGDLEGFDESDALIELDQLRYRLHTYSEQVYGLEPPDGAATAHAELAAALAGARDATAEVAEAAEVWGADGVRQLVHEWRGTLFRVRLARLRLATPAPRGAPAEEAPPAGIGRPLAAFLLALAGAVAFAGGAAFGYWPVWAAALLAVCAAAFAYRP